MSSMRHHLRRDSCKVNGRDFYEAMHDPPKVSEFRQDLMSRQIDANGL